MKLIAGLGNPEAKYMKTRHNTGFMVLDEILRVKNIKLCEKFKSFFAKDGDVLYCLPKTYMNLSGQAIAEIVNFFKLDVKDILIVYDDISLPLGTLRFRPDGSDGGHNGIKSVIKETGFKNFDRLKVGIGPQPSFMPSEKFVLGEFGEEEKEKLGKVIKIAANASLDWLVSDMTKLQSLYNKNHL
ncbi:MAG: aminoacyl-tRNA hydrolase [bacterium]|nr:aminoacyl-tRNA hydrolase [bacterium]